MKFGFSTYFYLKKESLEVVEEAAPLGIRVFELSQQIPHALNMDKRTVAKIDALKKEGIEFSMHAPFFEINLGSYFEDIRLISKERIKKALDLAGIIGVNPVVVHPGYTFFVDKVKDVEERTRENFMEDLREIYLYARERGLSIALENVHMSYFFFYELDEFRKIHEAAPGVGMCLDVGHAFITKCAQGVSSPEDAILADLKEIGIEHLFHVHLHNNLGVKDDHTFLQGSIDLKKIIRGLDGMGYGGKIIIESYDMEEYGTGPVIEKMEELRRGSP
ncbi:MAG: hypothetical protein C0392_04220 [Syntrophus sp. (in: bacteria)]|nr:hypothetical protein [Syntrophus sp. (in: bacteria)]